jgi:hypothetical protein
MRCRTLPKPLGTSGTRLAIVQARQKASITRAQLSWLTMSEYTHNDDVADMIYAKEQEIKLLKEALLRIETELNRINNEYSRGL